MFELLVVPTAMHAAAAPRWSAVRLRHRVPRQLLLAHPKKTMTDAICDTFSHFSLFYRLIF